MLNNLLNTNQWEILKDASLSLPNYDWDNKCDIPTSFIKLPSFHSAIEDIDTIIKEKGLYPNSSITHGNLTINGGLYKETENVSLGLLYVFTSTHDSSHIESFFVPVDFLENPLEEVKKEVEGLIQERINNYELLINQLKGL